MVGDYGELNINGELAIGMDPKLLKKGRPKRRKRENDLNLPPRFDLDQVSPGTLVFLPGGLARALEEALRLREHPFKGCTMELAPGLTLQPAQWILRKGPVTDHEDWWLVYSLTQENAIVVSRTGAYHMMTREELLSDILDIRGGPSNKNSE